MTNNERLEMQRVDHLGIVAGICHEIGLVDVINERVGASERQVSCGHAVLAMVLNALGFSGRALYWTFDNRHPPQHALRSMTP